jgi:hypothetical protein
MILQVYGMNMYEFCRILRSIVVQTYDGKDKIRISNRYLMGFLAVNNFSTRDRFLNIIGCTNSIIPIAVRTRDIIEIELMEDIGSTKECLYAIEVLEHMIDCTAKDNARFSIYEFEKYSNSNNNNLFFHINNIFSKYIIVYVLNREGNMVNAVESITINDTEYPSDILLDYEKMINFPTVNNPLLYMKKCNTKLNKINIRTIKDRATNSSTIRDSFINDDNMLTYCLVVVG